eukprot:34804_1
MKIVSWNVNGLRSVLGYAPWCHEKKDRLHRMLDYFESDILCFQETKITRDKLSTEIASIDGYISFYSFCNTRNGYSGVSTYIRESQTYLQPIKAQDGFTGILKSNDLSRSNLITPNELLSALKQSFTESRLKALDNEGRCLITQHQHFLLFNIYFPNGNGSEDRLKFKSDYHECIKIVIRYFITHKQNVIVVGDFNAKYQMIDSCDPGDPSEFYERKSTQWFRYLVSDKDGLQMVDTMQYMHPDFAALSKKPYTCWDTYTFARDSNYGTRIDYIVINKEMMNQDVKLSDANVMQSVKGSDHCPVFCTCQMPDLKGKTPAVAIPKLANRFMPEFSGKQTTLKAFFTTAKPKDRKRKLNQISKPLLSSGIAKKKQKLNHGNANDIIPANLWICEMCTFHNAIQSKQCEMCQNVKIKSCSSSSKQWQALFGKKKPKPIPLCSGHDEKCSLRTVTKKGANRGKKFYCCARGKGDPKNPNSQCGFFEWFDK